MSVASGNIAAPPAPVEHEGSPIAAPALALAWLLLEVQQLSLATSALMALPLESAFVALAACAAWAAASWASSAVGASRGPAAAIACGVVSSVAGMLLVFPSDGAWPLVLLFAHVALACEAVARALSFPFGRSGRAAVAVAGCGLLVAATAHALARAVAGSFGSFGNAGFYAQVSVVVVSLLPACAATAWAFSPARQVDAPEGSVGDGARKAAIPGVLALATLYGLLACVSMVFSGVVAVPHQVDMLVCGDRASVAIAVVGAFALALSHVRRMVGFACGACLALLSLVGMVGSMVSYAVAADPASPLPLAAVQAAGACLFASAWALCALVGVPERCPRTFAVLLVAVAVPARFIGLAVKHAVGLDGRTTVAFVLVATVILAVALLASVVAVAASSRRALLRVTDERASAIKGAVESALEDAVEDLRHDPDHAFDALHQVYSDALAGFDLSEREVEIAVLLLEKNGIEEVGEAAGISTNTVRWHLKNIYTKTGVTGKKMLRAKVDELISAKSR